MAAAGVAGRTTASRRAAAANMRRIGFRSFEERGPQPRAAEGGPATGPHGAARDDGEVPEVEVRPVSTVDDVLRGELLTCWTDVSNAGGAVGFVPPVTEGDVAPVLARLL